MWDLAQHSYEEIRNVVVDVISGTGERSAPQQWSSLVRCVADEFARRGPQQQQGNVRVYRDGTQLHPSDAELVRDVFWDLFRQGFVTLGLNDSNPNWPFFRLSHFGKGALENRSPYRFHDTNSFLALARAEMSDISDEAVIYLEEAVASFYADCLLACCVMLGVAAEAEFVRLLDAASKNRRHGSTFAAANKPPFIRQKIVKFQAALIPLLPTLSKECSENLETNLSAIQAVLRVARNEAGHPTGATPSREQVYIFLQLFLPFARQLKRLRDALS